MDNVSNCMRCNEQQTLLTDDMLALFYMFRRYDCGTSKNNIYRLPVGSRKKSNEAFKRRRVVIGQPPLLTLLNPLQRVNLTSVTFESSLGRSADSHGDYSTSLSLSTEANPALTFSWAIYFLFSFFLLYFFLFF